MGQRCLDGKLVGLGLGLGLGLGGGLGIHPEILQGIAVGNGRSWGCRKTRRARPAGVRW
jgi:hypothetical protein